MDIDRHLSLVEIGELQYLAPGTTSANNPDRTAGHAQ